MRFEKLLQHVQRAEQRVELRATHAQLQWATLKQTWRAGWTPGRIVIAGLVSGFLAGRAEPLRAMNGARWMQMFTAVSSFLATETIYLNSPAFRSLVEEQVGQEPVLTATRQQDSEVVQLAVEAGSAPGGRWTGNA